MDMLITGFQKTTLIDYPGRMASIVFTGGCPFRCPYCQNASLVTDAAGLEPYDEEVVFSHLKKRKGILDGLVISGGEPTLQKDLPAFISKAKALGYPVKLDTNGSNPDMLESLIDAGLLDYVAMDIKQCREKYSEAAGTAVDITKIERSVDILKTGRIEYEFRTTVPDELFEDSDFEKIAEWLKGAKHYYLQPYRDSANILKPGIFQTPSKERMSRLKALLVPLLPDTEVELRGEE